MRVTSSAACAAAVIALATWSAAASAPSRAAMAGAPGAGSAASGWSAAQCGREPSPPAIDTSTVQRYNASVDQVTAYDQAARTFNACVSRQATAEQTAISNEARTRIEAIQAVSSGVQKRIAANFAVLADALRRGAVRVGAH